MCEQNNIADNFSIDKWSKVKLALFDRTEVFKAEIEPLLKAAQDLCHKHGISFFGIAGVSNDADGCGYAQAFSAGGDIENLTLEPLLMNILADASSNMERLVMIQAVTEAWEKKMELEKADATTETVGDEQ
jgi:hypothetical protein